MDSNRFDNFARRLSRRKAIGAAGAAGMAAAVSHVLPSSAQGGRVACTVTMQALTSAGPSTGQAYSGVLELPIAGQNAIDQGTFTPDGGVAASVVGQSNGRALSLRVTFADGQALVLTGVGENDLSVCSGALSGTFSGPQLGDTGSWRIDPSQSQLSGVVGGVGATATSVPAMPEETATSTPCAEMTCDDPFVLDPETCECGCPPPYEVCGFVCCPAGSVCTDPDAGECSCPEGTELCGDYCVASCEVGSYLDYETCQCAEGCGPISCAEGETLDPETCLCAVG